MPTRTQPISFRTHTIHSPERGSFSNLPEKMARHRSGKAKPMLRMKKVKNPTHTDPELATHVSKPRIKGPMQGAATTPRVKPIKRLPKYPAWGFEIIRAMPLGKRSSQNP